MERLVHGLCSHFVLDRVGYQTDITHEGLKMLTLLSSGATRRYRDDIIRALALPVGAELQFRYDRRFIEPECGKEKRFSTECERGDWPHRHEGKLLQIAPWKALWVSK